MMRLTESKRIQALIMAGFGDSKQVVFNKD